MNLFTRKFHHFLFVQLGTLLTISGTTIAQEQVKSLLLNQAIEAAQSTNLQVALTQTEQRISDARYKETDAIYLPQVNLSYGGMVTNNPLNAFGFKLQQKSITQNDFNPALLNDPDGTTDFMTKLTVQQPIYNADMLYMRKAAAVQVEAAALKVSRTKEAVALMTEQAYLGLQMAYAGKAVVEESLNGFKQLLKFTQDRYDAGLLQKSDVLQVSVQVKAMETRLAEANTAIQNASDQLSMLMNVPGGIIYQVPALVAMEGAVTAIDSVPAERSDLLAMLKGMEAYDYMIQSTRNSRLPKVNGFASYQLNDKDPWGFGAGAYLAGVQVSWDIFRGNQDKRKIATQKLEKQQLEQQLQQQVQQSNVEVKKTYRQISDIGYKINQGKASVEQVQESLRILNDRYTQGLVNTTDVVMTQTLLSQQQLGLIQAYMEKGMATAYLKFLLSSTK